MNKWIKGIAIIALLAITSYAARYGIASLKQAETIPVVGGSIQVSETIPVVGGSPYVG